MSVTSINIPFSLKVDRFRQENAGKLFHREKGKGDLKYLIFQDPVRIAYSGLLVVTKGKKNISNWKTLEQMQTLLESDGWNLMVIIKGMIPIEYGI